MEMKKVILISGGSDGLGKALAMQLVQTHAVVILAHNKERVQKAAEEIGCDFVCADVSNYSEVETAVQEVIVNTDRFIVWLIMPAFGLRALSNQILQKISQKHLM